MSPLVWIGSADGSGAPVFVRADEVVAVQQPSRLTIVRLKHDRELYLSDPIGDVLAALGLTSPQAVASDATVTQ